MAFSQWDELAQQALDGLGSSHQLRARIPIIPIDATHVIRNGDRLLNFATNNYLGLTHHPLVATAMEHALREFGAGSGAASLVSGYSVLHQRVEQRLANWKGTQGAVLLPSGYQANYAAVQTLSAVADKLNRSIRFLLDKLCHASLIDAVRSAGKPFRIFPHNHLQKLERLLADVDDQQMQVVVTESIFSMDGDAADLTGLANLKKSYPFFLLLDEAHATGVYGAAGNGLAGELQLEHAVDVTVVTLSKSMGCGGGVVCGSKQFCDALVNFARVYIYSTSVPPMIAAGAEAAIQVMANEPHRQRRVRQLAMRLRNELQAAGWKIPAGDSPIIPLLLGSESSALNAAEELIKAGIFTSAIRPPTVPKGTSRLRLSLSSCHTDDDVAQLICAIDRLPRHAASANP